MAAAPPPCSSCSCSCRIRGRKQAPAGRRALPTVASRVPCFLLLLLLVVSCPAALVSAAHGGGGGGGGGRKHAAAARAHAQQTLFRAAGDEREAYRRVMARMARMDRDSNMTIQVIFPFPAVLYSTPFPTNLLPTPFVPVCAR
jgi:hypothetical protein